MYIQLYDDNLLKQGIAKLLHPWRGHKLIKNSPSSTDIQAGVYKIPCKSCNKFYIGETGRDLSVRIKEHKTAVKNLKTDNGISNHTLETSHIFNFEKAELLYPCKNLHKRHLIESALIIDNSSSCVNQNNGFSPHNKLLANIISSLIVEKHKWFISHLYYGFSSI